MPIGSENMPPNARKALEDFYREALDSPELNASQKLIIEDLLRKAVKTWFSKNYV